MSIVGVILAAGKASRMGRVKQLLPFRGKTILQCVIDNAVASSLQEIVVVLGYQADLIEPLITGDAVTVVTNNNYKCGQSSSLKAGLMALPKQTEAVLFMLGDQPLVSSETINRILKAYQTSKGPVVLPVFNGKRGNPTLFSRETFLRMELLNGDSCTKILFEEYAGRIITVPVDDDSIHFDVDTEADYLRLLEYSE